MSRTMKTMDVDAAATLRAPCRQPDHHRRPAAVSGQLGVQPGRRLGWAARRCCWCASRTCGASRTSSSRAARRRDRLALRRDAAARPATRGSPGGGLGLRGPAADLAAGARGVGDRLHRLQPARTARLAGDDARLHARSAGSGPVMPPEDKDAALFPRRFDGRWAMIHRPSPLRGGAHMWISYSPDLRHWGDHSLLLEARDGAWWDAGKIGLGPPPLETPEGWLLVLSRRPRDLGGADLPGRPGAARPRRPAHRPAPDGRVGLRTGGAVRAQRRRQQGRVPDRLGARPGDRTCCRCTTGPATRVIALATARLRDVLDHLADLAPAGAPAIDGQRRQLVGRPRSGLSALA